MPLAGPCRGVVSVRRPTRFTDAPDRRDQKHELRLGGVGESARAPVSGLERTEIERCRESIHPDRNWSIGAEWRYDEGPQGFLEIR